MLDLEYELKRICRRNRDGSRMTQAQREQRLRLIARELNTLGYRNMHATSLKPKHVEALVKQWRENELSVGTIKNRLADLRWWAGKVGKPPAARVLRAYRTETALTTSQNPNFDPHQFASSHDTVYIAAPAHQQALLAPLIVGLLTEIRQATYQHTNTHGLGAAPVMFMLDECANIAPIPDLPAMLSEAGGQGLQTVVVLQDLSQARRHWKTDADGILTLFGAKAILTGIADTTTLEQLSLLCGEYDRPIQTITNPQPTSSIRPSRQNSNTESWTTRKERRLPPDQIAQIPQGQALIMIGPHWQLTPTLPHHKHPAFAEFEGHSAGA